MKIFLDTNVLLDWVLARELTFGQEARSIIQLSEQRVVESYISGESVYT